MLQRTAGTFIAKKIKDELFAPPPADVDDEPERRPSSEPQRYEEDNQDGAEYRDEDGRLLGYTRRVTNIAVYAVTSAHGNAHAALSEALRDPNSQLVFQSTNGRVSGLIYIPDPDSTPGSGSDNGQGFRSDDV
ncbi:MAG: hypothetical protein WKF81_08440 [Thermomicrobiales bacterium]